MGIPAAFLRIHRQAASVLRLSPLRIVNTGLRVGLTYLQTSTVAHRHRNFRCVGVESRQVPQLAEIGFSISLRGPLAPDTFGDALNLLRGDLYAKIGTQINARLVERVLATMSGDRPHQGRAVVIGTELQP